MTSLSFSPRSFSFFFFIYQQSPPDLILFISERRSLSFNIFKLGKVHNKWFRSIFLPTTCTPISSVYRECQVVWPQMIESGPHLNIFLSLSLQNHERKNACVPPLSERIWPDRPRGQSTATATSYLWLLATSSSIWLLDMQFVLNIPL